VYLISYCCGQMVVQWNPPQVTFFNILAIVSILQNVVTIIAAYYYYYYYYYIFGKLYYL
jgi:hypothetical protein